MNEMFKKIVVLFSLCFFASISSTFAYVADVSAYTHTGGVMANGEYPYEGAVAADDLPIGTQILINGKQYVVKDRFGGGYSGRIDIFMDSYQDAINFGRQQLEVTVL